MIFFLDPPWYKVCSDLQHYLKIRDVIIYQRVFQCLELIEFSPAEDHVHFVYTGLSFT